MKNILKATLVAFALMTTTVGATAINSDLIKKLQGTTADNTVIEKKKLCVSATKKMTGITPDSVIRVLKTNTFLTQQKSGWLKPTFTVCGIKPLGDNSNRVLVESLKLVETGEMLVEKEEAVKSFHLHGRTSTWEPVKWVPLTQSEINVIKYNNFKATASNIFKMIIFIFLGIGMLVVVLTPSDSQRARANWVNHWANKR